MPEHFSFSALRQLMSCPLQYRLQRIDRIEPSHRSSALVLGSCYHAAIAHVLRQLQEFGQPTVDQAVEIFDSVWKTEITLDHPPIRWPSSTTPEKQYDLGLRMVGSWFEQALPIFGDASILAVEEPFEIPLVDADGLVLDRTLAGVFDAIIQTDDGVFVIDHKTAASSYGQTKLELDLQTTAYVYAADFLGYEAPQFAFHVMSKRKEPKLEVVHVQRLVGDFDRLFWVARMAQRLIEHRIFLPAAPGWQCECCEFVDQCRDAHFSETLVPASWPVAV
jgi:CRISPR/Cas system-associated exonuclease Cas4 (RecB family)